MIKFTTKLNDEMTSTLNKVMMQGSEDYEFAHECYRVIYDIMIKLKNYIQGYQFQDKQEEILFFKEIKPSFHSQLIYYIELMHIQARKPAGNEKAEMIAFLKKRVHGVHLQMENYQHIYMYLRTKRDTDDHLLFLRNSDYFHLIPEDTIDSDLIFSTATSTAVSKLMAWEKLLQYLNDWIENLDSNKPIPLGDYKLVWTHSKVALIELAYALHSCKALNLGKVDVKQIIQALEKVFNVDVGNFYRVFQSIRIRQGSRTSFLDELTFHLGKRMDDTDLGLN